MVNLEMQQTSVKKSVAERPEQGEQQLKENQNILLFLFLRNSAV